MGKNSNEKDPDVDPRNLEAQFYYLKHHMRFLSETQKKKVTNGMPRKLREAFGVDDEHHLKNHK